jgi:nucleotide-binding universal stress UspA family protein
MSSTKKQSNSVSEKTPCVLVAVYDEQLGRVQCDFVARHPWPLGTIIHLLFVVELDGLPILAPGLVVDIEREEKKYGHFLCQSLTNRLNQQLPGRVLMSHVISGAAKDEILKFADREHPDLIVLGSRPHHGLERVISASVSQDIAQHANCSTYIVRIPEEQAAVADNLHVGIEDLPVQMTSYSGSK